MNSYAVPPPLAHPGSPISASFHPTQSEKSKHSLNQCYETRQADHERERDVVGSRCLQICSCRLADVLRSFVLDTARSASRHSLPDEE